MADGRNLFHGELSSPTWLYDLAVYGTFSLVGGSGLVGLKAFLCGVVAVLMLRLSWTSGWRLPLAVTGLAVLAMSSRLLLQPATASVFCFTLLVWHLYRHPPKLGAPGWRLALLFVVWSNLDGRFVFGLGLFALVRFGQILDDRPRSELTGAFRRWAGSLGLLVAVSCLSVAHVHGLKMPQEVRAAVASLAGSGGDTRTVHSPFDGDYFALFRNSSAALAYYPLLALGAISFLLNWPARRWGWLLPWAGLAVVSGLQVRTVPFFAVVAGPVTAWNLQAYFARRTALPVRPRVRYVGLGLAGAGALAFLVAAWPGWLQGPPFEPRRWTAEYPAAVVKGAEVVGRTHAAGLWAADSQTLHVSPDTLGTFAWFCPEDRGLRDEALVAQLLAPEGRGAARERLRALRVSRAVAYIADPDPASRAMIGRLLADSAEWRVLSVWGGCVVFGWNDPDRAAGSDPLADWEVNFERLAFRPDDSEVAPGAGPGPPRRWWAAFRTPAYPSRPPGGDEAAVLLLAAESKHPLAPLGHLRVWESGQLTALVGAATGWTGPAGLIDAPLRLTFFRPPLPEGAPLGARPPPLTELTFAFQQRFAFERGQVPVGLVYAAVRAARRAVAESPTDAGAHLVLAQAYRALGADTAEQAWAPRVPQILRVRQIQASAALNRAVALSPRLAPAHLELSRLYRATGCLDLALEHLRAYSALSPRWDGPRKGDRFAEQIEAEVKQLAEQVDLRTRAFVTESAHSPVSDRALRAVQLELGGTARDLLLKSDVAAFGPQGTELEIDLLLRTGRPRDVLEWTTPEVRGSLGDLNFHWSRAQALLALGDYDAADVEVAEMVGPGGRLTAPAIVGEEVAGVVGKSLLDEQPGGFQLQQLVWRGLSRSDLRSRVADIGRKLGLEADITVLRGVVALEAGHIPRARQAFRAALVLAPSRWAGGQLEFGGRRIAWDCLALIDREHQRPGP